MAEARKGSVVASPGQRVKAAAQTASYGALIAAGAALVVGAGAMLTISLVDEASPQSIMDASLESIQHSGDVEAVLGAPIKGFTSYRTKDGRYRRAKARAHEFARGEMDCKLVKYSVAGPEGEGIAVIEMAKTKDEGWTPAAHYVHIPSSRQTIVLVDRYGLIGTDPLHGG